MQLISRDKYENSKNIKRPKKKKKGQAIPPISDAFVARMACLVTCSKRVYAEINIHVLYQLFFLKKKLYYFDRHSPPRFLR